MARKTKAERLAELQAELEQRRYLAASTYPSRLMAVLERADLYFQFSVKDGLFRVSDMENYRDEYLLSYSYSQDADNVLSDLEFAVQRKEDARAEAERRANLRKAALNKLSDEEREILGL
mgnify:CR=1 FL=1